MSFSQSTIALALDGLGRRYGKLPSEVVGLPPDLGRTLLFNISILRRGLEEEQKAEGLTGKLRRKRMSWNQDLRQEARRNSIVG